MKQLFIVLTAVILTASMFLPQQASAQTPKKLSYQAVIRNSTSQLVVNTKVGMRVSILLGSVEGTPVFSETQTPTTNANGLVSIEIGGGLAFEAINWGGGTYFLKTETDPAGGSNYSIVGTSQLLSVPYALFAAKAGNAFSGNWLDLIGKPNFATVATTGDYADLLNKPTLFSGSYDDLTSKPTLFSGSYTDLTNKPTLFSGNYADLTNLPVLATVATSGSYADLQNKPLLVYTATNPKAGDILFNNGSSWELLPKGENGQTLQLNNGLPTWGEPGYALPLVTTLAASNVLTTSAATGGNVISTGYTSITAKGVCWATTQNPTIVNNKTTDGTSIGNFTSSITGLTPGTTYYVRAYATNTAGTAYGNQITIQAILTIVFPTVTTAAATNVTESAATCTGNATAAGGATVTEKGICWSTNQSPTILDSKIASGEGTGSFTVQLSSLAPNVIYYARAYAINSSGVGYGAQVTFTTLKTLPIVATKNITSISSMGAVTGGTITSAGGGTISDKGICWSEAENPTVNDTKISSGAGTAAYTSAIITAVPGTIYYVRAYATNELGTVYGTQKTFTALSNVTYYDFETGMKPAGWGGSWTVTNSKSFDGSYCLKSLPGQSSETSLTVTLANAGQISFYYFLDWGTSNYYDNQTHLIFYIDNVNIYDFAASGGWNQGLFDVTAGKHTFKWQFNQSNGGAGYIDYIVMPK